MGKLDFDSNILDQLSQRNYSQIFVTSSIMYYRKAILKEANR